MNLISPLQPFQDEVSQVEDHQMTNLQMMAMMTGGKKEKIGVGSKKEKKKSGQKAKKKK